MHNCIFTPHCIEPICDRSCPVLVETSYLLERNNIDIDSEVFRASDSEISKMVYVLDKFNGKSGGYVVPDTVKFSELLTYVAICKNWKGSKLHCTVYNLKFSKYLDELKQSWSLKSESESLEYMKIWSESSKVLIISNFDYVNFGDFESQTLLNLIQSRSLNKLTTILVSPEPRQLVSTKNSNFFSIILSKYLSYNRLASSESSDTIFYNKQNATGGSEK